MVFISVSKGVGVCNGLYLVYFILVDSNSVNWTEFYRIHRVRGDNDNDLDNDDNNHDKSLDEFGDLFMHCVV